MLRLVVRNLSVLALLAILAGGLWVGVRHAVSDDLVATSSNSPAPAISGAPVAADPVGAPAGATVYEDGSWVFGAESGCLAGGLCED